MTVREHLHKVVGLSSFPRGSLSDNGNALSHSLTLFSHCSPRSDFSNVVTLLVAHFSLCGSDQSSLADCNFLCSQPVLFTRTSFLVFVIGMLTPFLGGRKTFWILLSLLLLFRQLLLTFIFESIHNLALPNCFVLLVYFTIYLKIISRVWCAF